MVAPSLALIPTGFKDGKLYSVLPESGVGDFDVVRGSGATRVNKDGLIVDVRMVTGLELITNGGFDVDSNWTKTSAVIENGKAILDIVNGGGSSVLQSSVMTQNKTYKITFDAILLSGNGSLALSRGGNNNVTNSLSISQSGTFSQVLKWVDADNVFGIKRIGGGDFSWSIDNVSVKEVTNDTNIPRLDYTGGGCPSLLLEPQSTNLITYSEDFSDVAWNKGRSTITSNQITAPDNTLTADKWQITSDVGAHYIRVGATRTGDFTNSIYVKKGNYRYIGLANSGSIFAFDFDTETIIKNTISGGVDKLGNGWYRIFTTNTWASFNYSGLYYSDASGNELPTANGDEFYYIWGAQLEELPYSTSYIPTSGAIATRLADSVTGAGDATTFNDSEGVLYAEIAALSDDLTFRLISLSDGTNNNTIKLGYRSDSNAIYFEVKSNGAGQAFYVHTITDITTFSKVAVKYEDNDFALWVNGVEVTTDVSGITPIGLNQVSFNRGDAAQLFTGKVKDLRVYNTALTDAELMELTTI